MGKGYVSRDAALQAAATLYASGRCRTPFEAVQVTHAIARDLAGHVAGLWDVSKEDYMTLLERLGRRTKASKPVD